MIFFKRNKPPEKKPKKNQPLQEIGTVRVQTAEGWRRQLVKKSKY